MTKIKRAIISVSDKEGIIDFARGLHELNIEIISTGGTARLLQNEKIKVTSISEVTDFPEILEGRVKTLHPFIFGGILAKRESALHQKEMTEQKMDLIDLVVVNLYPFKETISKAGVTVEQARGNIDIGGPCMIRASAKNFIRVASVVDPSDYETIISEMKENSGSISLDLRFQLAQKAYEHTATYDRTIADFLKARVSDDVRGCYSV